MKRKDVNRLFELLRRNDMFTSYDDYEPTPSEEKLLIARLDPENLGKNITELCQSADVSRQFYYDCMKKPEFVELLNRSRMEALRNYIADVIDASYRVATTCGSRGYQDRRLLLELAGLYRPEQNLTFNANINRTAQLTDEEVDERIKKLLLLEQE